MGPPSQNTKQRVRGVDVAKTQRSTNGGGGWPSQSTTKRAWGGYLAGSTEGKAYLQVVAGLLLGELDAQLGSSQKLQGCTSREATPQLAVVLIQCSVQAAAHHLSLDVGVHGAVMHVVVAGVRMAATGCCLRGGLNRPGAGLQEP